ncbi:uncharacterized protein LOC110112940 isoform X1 [Dendrobium catenatum]|uniref:uncharacterized protein LOC110112940 isoform X1 n=2 Tax=Dendrobium catenatum TaxID=906689 RepID=UPI0009F44C5B|nr:uncharacterized protein LOC110112940 isoform X1 [Dendrobium catenatum]XP_020700992.1 uncharacterized protein LOC110112940 isoform X1 [Dendrobium catenatum]
MAVGIRMKRRVVDKYADRRRNKNIVGAKGHGGRYNMEDSDGEVFARVEELAHLPNMSVKGRNLRSSIKQSEKRFARREENDSELSSWRMRRSVVSKDVGRERKSFFGVRKERGKDVDAAKKGKAGDARLFAGKPLRAMRKVADEDFSDYEHNGGDFYRRRERSMKTEASAGKIRLKRRKFDVELAEDSPRCDAESVELEKHAVTKDGENQNSEQKPIRRPTRVLDKTGKKIRVQTKAMEKGSTETSVSKKTTRRVIKIDPYDISNKRLDDGVPKSDIAVEKETVVSMNAQFRAIQPSAGILSFVEENLLGRRRLIELQNAGYNVKLSAPLDNTPFSTATDREKIEDNVFRNKLEFFAAAKMSSSFPSPTLPEIAFAGRSNVGKSSLLNALTRQWGVVRVSDKPGLTQTINFFKLASKLCLVDLPGYGFAYAKEEVKENWEELVKEFVSTRVGLQRVCLLVDTKWGMKARDLELIELMERSKTPYQIVLTKTDIAFPIDVARRAMQIQENLKNNKSIIDPVMMVSSKSGAGIRTLRNVLAKIARFVKP